MKKIENNNRTLTVPGVQELDGTALNRITGGYYQCFTGLSLFLLGLKRIPAGEDRFFSIPPDKQ
ncbi:hypothetical protein [Spirosoma montaniterrae]|uniref:Uncharacterized protein n=1 Tax=Spirosoma montaniterrae TaxID=1178516 RepID=A0A1P9WXR5_9BACT|nr:hypothetical protein [Spirosoma montaniterrae]AQG80149.1 hypothetical protein AWR27_12950 [Spirosoma montaniterrae]